MTCRSFDLAVFNHSRDIPVLTGVEIANMFRDIALRLLGLAILALIIYPRMTLTANGSLTTFQANDLMGPVPFVLVGVRSRVLARRLFVAAIGASAVLLGIAVEANVVLTTLAAKAVMSTVVIGGVGKRMLSCGIENGSTFYACDSVGVPVVGVGLLGVCAVIPSNLHAADTVVDRYSGVGCIGRYALLINGQVADALSGIAADGAGLPMVALLGSCVIVSVSVPARVDVLALILTDCALAGETANGMRNFTDMSVAIHSSADLPVVGLVGLPLSILGGSVYAGRGNFLMPIVLVDIAPGAFCPFCVTGFNAGSILCRDIYAVVVAEGLNFFHLIKWIIGGTVRMECVPIFAFPVSF